MALSTCQSGFNKYKEFVIKNPFIASELESLLKWCSYLTAGRFSSSTVISEMIFSASSLLTLFNDLILRHAANIPVHINKAISRIYTCLMVVEYSEVFAELSAGLMGGEGYRWVAVTIIQIVKCILRLLLVAKHGQGISKSPTIAPLNRKRDLNPLEIQNGPNLISEEAPSSGQLLKRSGRTLRTLDTAPPLARRNWKPPDGAACSNGSLTPPRTTRINFPPIPLEGERMMGEILHVLRPLAHLCAIGFFGVKSWKPWLVALGCDMTSLQLLGGATRKVNRTEQPEINRRALLLLMYLLRSPFYEKYSKEKSSKTLNYLGHKIPLVGRFILPLSDYLPEWQKTYTHSWST